MSEQAPLVDRLQRLLDRLTAMQFRGQTEAAEALDDLLGELLDFEKDLEKLRDRVRNLGARRAAILRLHDVAQSRGDFLRVTLCQRMAGCAPSRGAEIAQECRDFVANLSLEEACRLLNGALEEYRL